MNSKRNQKVHRNFDIREVRQVITPLPEGSHELREWWHEILRNHGRFSCYAIFLILPSDNEATRYMTDFGRELDLISGNSCLIIALGRSEFKRIGFDKELRWSEAVKQQITEGYSLEVGKVFNINFSEFPCLIVFQNIRSQDYINISLKEMLAEEIAERLRLVFSIVHQATSNSQNSLIALENQLKKERLHKRGQKITDEIKSFSGKTFETAMEAWIKASIK